MEYKGSTQLPFYLHNPNEHIHLEKKRFWATTIAQWDFWTQYLSTFQIFDQSIASTKTKYIKLNTKTQNIFCRLNENLTTFLYTLTGATRKQKEKCIQKLKVIKKNLGFSI